MTVNGIQNGGSMRFESFLQMKLPTTELPSQGNIVYLKAFNWVNGTPRRIGKLAVIKIETSKVFTSM